VFHELYTWPEKRFFFSGYTFGAKIFKIFKEKKIAVHAKSFTEFCRPSLPPTNFLEEKHIRQYESSVCELISRKRELCDI